MILAFIILFALTPIVIVIRAGVLSEEQTAS
jgi:hypothetical protein